MKIHVGFIVQSMQVGGLERCVARLANGLDRDKFRVRSSAWTVRGLPPNGLRIQR